MVIYITWKKTSIALLRYWTQNSTLFLAQQSLFDFPTFLKNVPNKLAVIMYSSLGGV